MLDTDIPNLCRVIHLNEGRTNIRQKDGPIFMDRDVPRRDIHHHHAEELVINDLMRWLARNANGGVAVEERGGKFHVRVHRYTIVSNNLASALADAIFKVECYDPNT